MKQRHAILCAASLAAAGVAARLPAQTAAQTAPQALPAEPDAARIAAARALVATLGTEALLREQQGKVASEAEASFDRMVPAQVALRAQLSDPQGFARAREQAIKLLVDDRQQALGEVAPLIIDAEVRRYAVHFSLDELRALNTFYRSPLGQRLIAEQPRMAADTARFQQAVLAPIGGAHSQALTPKLAVLIGPILRQAGVTAAAAPSPAQRAGAAPARVP